MDRFHFDIFIANGKDLSNKRVGNTVFPDIDKILTVVTCKHKTIRVRIV